MIFRQIIHDDLGCASYLIGDERAGVAAVVDPRFEIGEYLELARYMGASIEHVFETHNHADHVSGHGRLAAATGATIHVHRLNAPDYPHEPFDDGDEFMLGALRVRALHTPGHRPEHTAFLLTDTHRGQEPWALLSGDTLFVGDIARPDLAIEKSEGAAGIFHSLRDTVLGLPPEVEVWPGHLGGSMCGGPGMDMKVCSTIGYERAHNPMLQIEDRDEFVARSLATLGHQPPNFRAIVELNRGPLLTETVELSPLAPRQVQARRESGALLVDVRTDLQFDEVHIPGSISIPILRAGFGTRLAWLADPEQEVVFIGRDDADGRLAGRLAAAIGLRRFGGFLQGGMTGWCDEERPVARTERLPAAALRTRLDAEPGLQVADVRERADWERAHIPGSVCAVWHDLTELPDGLDPSRPVAVICASGARAGTAAGLLARLGAAQVIHVVEGGVGDWAAPGRPLVTAGDAPGAQRRAA
jgi:hydroxyacylglutathione hydrolase